MMHLTALLTLTGIVWALRATLAGDWVGGLIIVIAIGISLELFTDDMFTGGR